MSATCSVSKEDVEVVTNLFPNKNSKTDHVYHELLTVNEAHAP